MARPTLSTIVRGAGAAAVLVAVVSCGGTFDEAAVAEPAGAGVPPPRSTATVDGSEVHAFEQVGASYADWLRSGPGACDGGRCTLSYEFVERSERPSGCAVEDFR